MGLIEHGEFGARGYSLNDVLDMNLAQTRAILNGGKQSRFKVSWGHMPSPEELQRHALAWRDFLIREYGAKP